MEDFLTNEEIQTLKNLLSTLETADKEAQKAVVLAILLFVSKKLRNEFMAPNDVIRHFLNQSNLPDSYLSKLLGSRSRACEILAGKRNLSLSDLRALRENLGIPSDLLLGHLKSVTNVEDYSRFPIPDMVKYGLLPKGMKRGHKNLEKSINKFFNDANFYIKEEKDACFRQSIRKNEKSDSYALQAWLAAVKYQAILHPTNIRYNGINNDGLRDLVKLSVSSDGPKRAIRFLNNYGINVIIMPHFRRTYLDGAIFKADDTPVVGLTIRYDRIDNFWHTLLHELSHLILGHINIHSMLLDDMELHADMGIEKEADDFAKQIYIDQESWDKFKSQRISAIGICTLANELGISPAIIAGRYRFETKKYKQFNMLIGSGEVRKHFPIFQQDISK